MIKGTVVARMTIDCGYFNELETWLLLDGTLHVSYSHLWPNVVSDVLVKWTPRDLIVASEYVAHRQDYYKAERGFRYVLYSRGCIAPRYPVPAIRQGFEFGQRWPDGECVMLEWKQERYD